MFLEHFNYLENKIKQKLGKLNKQVDEVHFSRFRQDFVVYDKLITHSFQHIIIDCAHVTSLSDLSKS